MKRLIILCIVALVGCSSTDTNWDSGGAKNNAYQAERMEEQTDNTNDQFPSSSPATEINVP
jgi:uncharacterized protein YceK